MCFSATASFMASGVLSAIGLLSLVSVSRQTTAVRSARYPLALTPLFFGVQQLAEGLVWLGVGRGWDPILVSIFGKSFLFFAYGIWPFWIPFALSRIEQSKARKQILLLLLAVGTTLSAVLLGGLMKYGATVAIVGHHVAYDVSLFPAIARSWVMVFVYMVPVVGSFFVMHDLRFRLFGALVFGSAALAYVIWAFWFTSIWCFFAALLSGMVVWLVRSGPRF